MRGSCKKSSLSSPGLTERPSIPETVISNSIGRGVLDRPPSRAMTTEVMALIPQDARPHPRGAFAPEFCNSFYPLQTEGAGKAGSSPPPWPACRKKARGRTTGSAETSRPSLRDGFTAYTRSPRGPALLPPSPARSSRRRLDLSTGRSGPHDFAVRVALFVRVVDHAAARHAHRIPHPTFVTIAKRPS